MLNYYKEFDVTMAGTPDVISAAGAMDGLPMQGSMSSMQPHFQDEALKVNVEGFAIDYNFLETMGLSLLEGRDFSEDFGSDLEHAVIVNEGEGGMVGFCPCRSNRHHRGAPYCICTFLQGITDQSCGCIEV